MPEPSDLLIRAASCLTLLPMWHVGVLHAADKLDPSATLPSTVLRASAEQGRSVDRTVLPIPEPKRPIITTFDARNVKAPPPVEVNARA